MILVSKSDCVGTAARAVGLGLLLAVFWITLRWAPVGADEGATGRLVELVAKVTFNEALGSYDDLAMIWQIVEARGGTDAERVYWLERHSSCVSGRLTQDQARLRPGNCRWARNLSVDGRRPRGWVRAEDGHWSQTRGAWLAHLESVRGFVRGRDDYRPCAINPASWDGGNAVWVARAEARGWVRVVCIGNARNAGYVRGVSR